MAHWSEKFPNNPVEADAMPTEEMVRRILNDRVPEVSEIRQAVANRLMQLDQAKRVYDPPTDAMLPASDGGADGHDVSALPQPPARKKTSAEMASLASRILGAGYFPTTTEVRSLAGSVLSQDETRGSE